MKLIGAIVLVGGLFLFFGNISGVFPTFPGAGWITIIIGAALWKAGDQ